jgi:hypothetical protein
MNQVFVVEQIYPLFLTPPQYEEMKPGRTAKDKNIRSLRIENYLVRVLTVSRSRLYWLSSLS